MYHAFDTIFFIHERYVIIIHGFLCFAKDIFNDKTWRFRKLNSITILKFDSTLANLGTTKSRSTTKRCLQLLMAVKFVLVIWTVYFEGGHRWVMRYLLTIDPLSRFHFSLQGLAKNWIERHFTIHQRLVNKIRRNKKGDNQFHSFQRVRNLRRLIQILQ